MDSELGRVWEHFPGGTEQNYIIHYSGVSVSSLSIEVGTSELPSLLGTLFYLTTAAGHFSSACLCNLDLQLITCLLDVARGGERKGRVASTFLNAENLILTAVS